MHIRQSHLVTTADISLQNAVTQITTNDSKLDFPPNLEVD